MLSAAPIQAERTPRRALEAGVAERLSAKKNPANRGVSLKVSRSERDDVAQLTRRRASFSRLRLSMVVATTLPLVAAGNQRQRCRCSPSGAGVPNDRNSRHARRDL